MLPDLGSAKILAVPLRWCVLGMALAILSWNVCLRWEMLWQYRTELGGVEHNVVYGIQKLLLGIPLYQDPEAPPFDVIQYTPSYYVVCALAAKVFGIAGDDARAIFLLSRSVALCFNILMAFLVYRTCRILDAPSWASGLAAIFSFCTLWEQSYSRMDAMAAALAFGAIMYFAIWLKAPRHRWLILCALLSVTSFMTKQSGIVVMILPGLYLLTTAQWIPLRTMTISILCFSIPALGMLSCFGTLHACWQNIVHGLANGYSFQLWQDLVYPPTYKYFVGWHILMVLIIVHAIRSSSPGLRFLALAIPFSLAFALATGLKYGSRLNYLHESLVLTFIGTAVLLNSITNVRWNNRLAWGSAFYGCLFAGFRTNSAMTWYRVGEPDAQQQQVFKNDLVMRHTLLHDLHLQPNDFIFITYRDYLEHYFVGQSLLTQKDIVQYSRHQLFDYSRFHAAMRDGSVRFIITDQPPAPIVYMDSTYTGWAPIRQLNGYTIFALNDRP